MNQYIRWILRYRILVIIATTLVTALLVLQVKSLRIVFDPNTMLPQSHPYVAATNQVEEVFGGKYIVVVGITPKHGDIYQATVLSKVQRITSQLLLAPNVVKANTLSVSARKAKSITGVADGLLVEPLLGSELSDPASILRLKKAIATNPIYRNSIVSADSRTAAVIVEFKRNTKGFREIVDNIMPIIDSERDGTVDIAVGGVPIYVANLEKYSQRMIYLFPLAILIIGLIHLEAFRTLQGLLLPLVTALLAVGWGVGIMAILDVPMDAFNSTTPILILAVAAGHAVQLLKRYYEEYNTIRSTTTLAPKDANHLAVVQSFTRVAPVMLTAGFVAAMGFFSLSIFDIVTVRTFGIFTGIGILSAVVLELTFTPAIRSLMPAPIFVVPRGNRRVRMWDVIILWLSAIITSQRRVWIYVCAIALIVIALIGTSLIQIDNSTKTYFSRSLPFQQDDAFLNQRLGGTNTLYVVVEGKSADTIKDPEVLRAMDAVQQYLDAQPLVGKTVSLADLVKRMNQAMHSDNPTYFRIPDNRDLISQYLLFYSLSGEPGDFDLYVNQDYRIANVVAYLKTDSSAYIEKLVPALSAFVKNKFPSDKVSVRIGGSVPQAAAMNDVMVNSKLLNILQIASVVFFVSSLVFQSFIGGLLVLLPLIAAVLINFGLIGLTGIRLSIPTSLTSAMAVGIGADYAIYMIYRMRESLRDGMSPTEAVAHTMQTAGTACLYVALAVAGGYSVLLLSFGFHIHAWIAILIIAAMTVSVLAAITLIPSWILTFRPRFIFREFDTKRVASATVAVTIAFLIGLLHDSGSAHAEPPDAGVVMAKNYEATRVAGSLANATFRLINSNQQERIRKTVGITKLQPNGADNMRVTRFLTPTDIRGTVTLLIEHTGRDDDIWIYLPALKKVRRLVASNKKDSFVGTDFSYGDIIGHRAQEWTHRLIGEETIDGQPCYVIESAPVNDAIRMNTGYAKRITWVRKDNYMSSQARFWDEHGQILKLTTVRDIRHVDPKNNKWQGMILETTNLQTDHKTIIQFDDFRVDHNIRDDYFTTRYMERPE